MNCPNCPASLTVVEYEGVEIDACDSCGGQWLDEGELKKIIQVRQSIFSEEQIRQAKSLAVLKNPASLDKHSNLLCPKCSLGLHSFQFSGTTSIRIDKCESCGGIWLDADELEQIQALVEDWESRLSEDEEHYGELIQAVRRQRQRDSRHFTVKVSRFGFVNALANGMIQYFS